MSFTPEQSRFTACLLGEGSPAEQAAFDAALLGDAALRAEAVALSRTAHRLEEALRREAARALAGPPRQAGLPRAASPVRRQARAVSWRGPTLATAALFALGLGGLALPWGSPPQVGDSPGGGLARLVLQPAVPGRKGALPPASVPSLEAAGVVPGALPILPPGPVAAAAPEAMAAALPTREILRPPAAEAPVRSKALGPPPDAPAGPAPPAGSLASPAPRQP